MVAIYTYTRTTEILWRKRGCVATLQVKEGAPDPCLDRLLLFFWAHSIGGNPHLLCTGSPQVIDYLLRRTKDRTLLITTKRRMLQLKGEVCSYSILRWSSTDFRKMKILSKHLLPQFRVREF